MDRIFSSQTYTYTTTGAIKHIKLTSGTNTVIVVGNFDVVSGVVVGIRENLASVARLREIWFPSGMILISSRMIFIASWVILILIALGIILILIAPEMIIVVSEMILIASAIILIPLGMILIASGMI